MVQKIILAPASFKTMLPICNCNVATPRHSCKFASKCRQVPFCNSFHRLIVLLGSSSTFRAVSLQLFLKLLNRQLSCIFFFFSIQTCSVCLHRTFCGFFQTRSDLSKMHHRSHCIFVTCRRSGSCCCRRLLACKRVRGINAILSVRGLKVL